MRPRLFACGAVLVMLSRTRAAFAAPTFAGESPPANTAVPDSVDVAVTVTSTSVVTSVTAQIGTVSTPMTNTLGTSWTGTLDISTLPLGPVVLTITANDAGGGTATSTVNLEHDHPPVLTILTPDSTVARPDLRLQATCADSDLYGCASLAVDYAQILCRAEPCEGSLTSTASSSLDQTVSLASLDQSALRIIFTATDAAGMKTVREVVAYAEAGPHLARVDTLPGRVLDIDATRILFEDGRGNVAIKDRASGTVTTYGAGHAPSTAVAAETYGHLFSNGAAWVGGEVRGGTFASRPSYPFRAAGGWLAWCDPDLTDDCAALHREHLTTGVIETLAAGNNPTTNVPSVDTAGTVAYSNFDTTLSRWNIHKVSAAGVDTTLVANLAAGPVVDGSNVVYHLHQSSPYRVPLYLITSAGTETLDSTSATTPGQEGPFVEYRANDGCVAYTKVVGGANTAWTRTPAGVTALASPTSGVGAIAALNASGEIAYDVGSQRSLGSAGATAPATPLTAGGAFGDMRYIGTEWYKIVGRDVMQGPTRRRMEVRRPAAAGAARRLRAAARPAPRLRERHRRPREMAAGVR